MSATSNIAADRGERPADHDPGAFDDRRRRPAQSDGSMLGLDRVGARRTRSRHPTAPHTHSAPPGSTIEVAELAEVAGRALGEHDRRSTQRRRRRRRRARAWRTRWSRPASPSRARRSASASPRPAVSSSTGRPVSVAELAPEREVVPGRQAAGFIGTGRLGRSARGSVTPTARRRATSVGLAASTRRTSCVERRPHVARRGGDAVADDDLARRASTMPAASRLGPRSIARNRRPVTPRQRTLARLSLGRRRVYPSAGDDCCRGRRPIADSPRHHVDGPPPRATAHLRRPVRCDRRTSHQVVHGKRDAIEFARDVHCWPRATC